MPEYNRPTTEEELKANFGQLKPLMNATMAYYESSRCLYCYDAPCVQACPTGIDIPLFIRQINNGNVDGAAKTIYDSNYFGNACGKVCPTSELCEGACVYNKQDVKPIEIGRLQSFATQQAMASNKQFFKPGRPNGKKIGIIGAGPAGISCACELRLLGYEVDIFEAKSKPSGLAVYGCAPYKITNKEIFEEMDYLQGQFGYTIHFNHPITTREQLDEMEITYDAIFLAIGLGATNTYNLAGVDLKNCIGATEFIAQLKIDPLNTIVGKKVVVIGGGNTAMDAASESARLGAEEVILAYRRSKEGMGAYPFEYVLAKGAGVKGVFSVSPVSVEGKSTVKGIKLIRTEEDEKGYLSNIEGSEFVVDCDMVILATGQSKKTKFLSMIEGLKIDKRGRIKINSNTGQTNNPMYFASGDAVNGGAEVVNACGEAKNSARSIHRILLKHGTMKKKDQE